MQYFVRELYVFQDPADEGFAEQDYEAAAKSYDERLEEIRDDLPKSIRKLLDDAVWMDGGIDGEELPRFVNDHFYIEPSEELTFLIERNGYMFVFRYTVDAMPVVEAPSKEEQAAFVDSERLGIMEEEWDLDGDKVVHRLLLTNGYIVTFRPKDFHWWKTKVEAHG